MSEWSNTWEFEDRENPGQTISFIKCMKCKKSMPEKFKSNHKCPAETPEQPAQTKEIQQNMGEFRKASEPTRKPSIEEDVTLLVSIAKQLSFDLGKKIEELNDGERAWVSTIFIQRTKVRF